MGTIQNTKNLTIKQIKQLILDNGLAANGNEYCLEALHASLAEKQQKAAEKAVKRAQLNDYYDLVFPPPVIKKFNGGTNSAKSDNFYSDSDEVNPVNPVNPVNEANKENKVNCNTKSNVKHNVKSNVKSNLFKFNAPLWKAENLSLDERILIFGKGK